MEIQKMRKLQKILKQVEIPDNNTINPFDSAVQMLRDGNIDDGLSAMENIEGEDIFKRLAMAEVAYWRRDWKNAMYLDEHSLTSDHLWLDPYVLPSHMRAYVMAALQTGSVSRAKCFLEYCVGAKRDNKESKALLRIFKNADLRLDGKPAKDEPSPVKLIEGDEDSCQIQMFSTAGPIQPGAASELPVSLLLDFTWNKVPYKVVLSLYEEFADYISNENHHIMAARTYMALGDLAKADECISRAFALWHPIERFQVMPMKFFVYTDVMEYIYQNGLHEKYLYEPRCRKREQINSPLAAQNQEEESMSANTGIMPDNQNLNE